MCLINNNYYNKTRGRDSTPNIFSFTSKTEVQRNATITPNAVSITGIDSTTTISIDQGSTATSVAVDDMVAVQLFSGSAFNTSSTAVLNVGGVTASFVITTISDNIPNPFSLAPITDATRNALVHSRPVRIRGFVSASISIESGSYTIDNGSPTMQDSTINCDSEVIISLATADRFNSIHIATLIVGTTQATFSVTTGVFLDVDANDGVLIHRGLNGDNQPTSDITMPNPKGVITQADDDAQIMTIITSAKRDANKRYDVDTSQQVDALDGLLIRRYLSNASNIVTNAQTSVSATLIIDHINRLIQP